MERRGKGFSVESEGGGVEDAEVMNRPKMNNGKNKKRFSDEQVKYLESVFESESKLEPRKKDEVAVELGMHPRQVAIWFQNKRARWKSKQIEQDYKALRASYDALTSRFESLNNEKQSLLAQLRQLGDLLEKPGSGRVSSDGGSDGGDVAKMSYLEGSSHDHSAGHIQQGPELLNGDVSMEANGKLFGFGSGAFYDQSCNISSQLWDFWSS